MPSQNAPANNPLSPVRPEVAWLYPDAIVPYKSLLHNLWFRLVRLNHSLLFMRTIEGIPWDLLFGPDCYTFWAFTYRSHGDSAVLLIHGLLNDDGADQLSLDRFKNKLANKWALPEKKIELRNMLAKCRCPTSLHESLQKIKNLRHNHIAHTLMPNIDPKQQPLRESLNWNELDRVFKYLSSCYSILGLDGQHALAWAGTGYDTGVGTSFKKTDLDRTLNAFLASSRLIHAPEKRPEAWRMKRKRLTANELEKFNHARSRLGLSPV